MELAGLQVTMDADFTKVEAAFNDINAVAAQFAKNVKDIFNSIPDLGKKFSFTTNGASQAAQDAREFARAEREAAQARLDNAKAAAFEERATQAASKQTKKQLDDYGILVKESNDLVRAYYNASAQIIRFGDAAEISAEKLEELRLAALKGQEQLKQIEAGAGRFQRNVGNYASGFNPLQNSISQLSREMPAFANSLQTGFMAISNNLGPLADAIKQVKAENAQLIAQGKPAQSVFSQVTGALFSWNTAISAGITLLTVYGPKLVDMIANTKGAAEAKARLKKQEEELNNIQRQAISTYAESVSKLKMLVSVAQDHTQTEKVRLQAVKELQNSFPETFGALQKQTILEGDLTNAINRTTDSLLRRAKVNASVRQATLIEDELFTVNEQLAETFRQIKQLEPIVAKLNKSNSVAFARAERRNDLENLREQYATLAEEALNLQNKLSNLYGTIDAGIKTEGDLFTENISKSSENASKKVVKDVETVEDAYKELEKTLKLLEKLNITNQISDKEFTQKSLEAQSSYLETLFGKFNYSADSKDVILTINLIESLRKQVAQFERQEKGVKVMSDLFSTLSSIPKDLKGSERIAKQLEAYKEAFSSEKGNSGNLVNFYGDNVKKFTEMLTNSKAAEKAKEFSDAMNLIQLKLGSGLISNAEASTEELKLLNKQMEDALKNGKIINAMVIKLKIDNKEALKSLSDTNELLSKELEATIASIIASTTVAVSEGFANIISGTGTIGDLFGTIISEIGSQIQRYGAFMAQSAAALIAAKRAWEVSFSNPYAMLAVSAAVVALGTYLKAEGDKRKGVNFASGGVVYGETFARVGEYSNARGNPEIIAPLDRLKNILQSEGIGGGRTLEPYFIMGKLRGDDILLSAKRAEKRFRR